MGYTILVMGQDFVEWLQQEIDARNWRPADLARAAGIYASTLAKILQRERRVGADVCLSLARRLTLPPETVFRKAGLLPDLPASGDDRTVYEIQEIARRLSPALREDVRDYALWRYKREHGEGK